MTNLVEIKDVSPNKDLIGQLEYLLDLAKEGKVRSLISVVGWSDDSVTHGWAVDRRNSEKRLAAEVSLLQTDLNLKILHGDNSYLDTILDETY